MEAVGFHWKRKVCSIFAGESNKLVESDKNTWDVVEDEMEMARPEGEVGYQ